VLEIPESTKLFGPVGARVMEFATADTSDAGMRMWRRWPCATGGGQCVVGCCAAAAQVGSARSAREFRLGELARAAAAAESKTSNMSTPHWRVPKPGAGRTGGIGGTQRSEALSLPSDETP
jgi:hypothetical protein